MGHRRWCPGVPSVSVISIVESELAHRSYFVADGCDTVQGASLRKRMWNSTASMSSCAPFGITEVDCFSFSLIQEKRRTVFFSYTEPDACIDAKGEGYRWCQQIGQVGRGKAQWWSGRRRGIRHAVDDSTATHKTDASKCCDSALIGEHLGGYRQRISGIERRTDGFRSGQIDFL